MNAKLTNIAAAVAVCWPGVGRAQITLESAPPVVVATTPIAGATNVEPSLPEIHVTYSKAMQDGSWSWSTWGPENYPETTGAPRYLDDHRTCALPVKLAPGKFYAIWLNSDQFKNFKDADGRPAVPYLLTFTTKGAGDSAAPQSVERAAKPAASTETGATAEPTLQALNADQRAVLAWTERQFRSFLDNRSFAGLSDSERLQLETRLIDTLRGPQSRDYYLAINTLGALRSTNGVPALREIAFDRRDKNNRDRWMAVRAIGIIGDSTAVPELIHLVYHGNPNTRWWAQISLVRLTGQNFGGDWNAWGKWWNESGGRPPYKPEIIKWWSGQGEDSKLVETVKEWDAKFLPTVK